MASNQTGRVLVIGDDMRIFLSIVRAFGRAGKTVEAFPYGGSPALKSRYISRIHATPDFESDQPGWKHALLNLLRTETYDLVVPCSDPAIIILDASRTQLAHQRLAIPPADSMDLFYDKEETHHRCESLEIAMAPSARLKPADTAESLIAAFGLPVVLKPRRTFFADREQAREVVEIVRDKAHLVKLLDSIEDRSRYLAEGFFVGEGVGVSVLASRGNILQAFQHRRLREGKGGPSSFRVSETVEPALLDACGKICAATKHTGVCMFEFRHNPQSGQWILIETNARFWGSMPLPLSLGLDYPNMLYDLMVRGLEPAARPYAAGIRSRNFMLDGYYLVKRLGSLSGSDMMRWLADAGDFGLQPIRWMTGSERSDSFVPDDLKPAFWEFTLLFSMLAKGLRAKSTAPVARSP